MPPHIAQLVAGHREHATPRWDTRPSTLEEVINDHRAFITRRRQPNAREEYRTPTDEEWEEFLGHFERRKVALATCGRALPPPLHPRARRLAAHYFDPTRSASTGSSRSATNLRRTHHRGPDARAGSGNWKDSKVSLAGARAKLAQLDAMDARRNTAVHLGVPRFPEVTGTILATRQTPNDGRS